MGVSSPSNVYGSIRSLEDRLSSERTRGNRWRTVAWVAILFLGLIAMLAIR